MKLTPDHELAVAALEIARKTLNKDDPRTAYLFKGDGAKLEYDLYSKGCVSIKAFYDGAGKITLSMGGYFKQNPIVSVRAKTGHVAVGPQLHFISPAVRGSSRAVLLAEANPKKLRKEVN